MKTTIRRIGNSQGVILPKPLISQLNFGSEVDMTVEQGALVLRKPRKKVRAGWAEASKAIAAAGDDKLVWPEFSNVDDRELQW